MFHSLTNRRSFLGAAAAIAGAGSLAVQPAMAFANDERPNVLGPRTGYSPQIGTLVSMMTWMRRQSSAPARGLTREKLDHLFDSRANSIGSLLLHLAATETYYQLNTFEGMKWGSWSEEIKQKWDAAMGLGDEGRAVIKGHDLDYYMKALDEARAKTLAEFRKRDDTWLMAVDNDFPWGPTNNLCKWFHVCEHESHHAGQIAFLTSRLG